jgi:hypothetical protein
MYPKNWYHNHHANDRTTKGIMKNHGENQAKRGTTGEELESLLHQVLREDGKIFPVSEEDIRNLEAEIDPSEVENIDPARLLARINTINLPPVLHWRKNNPIYTVSAKVLNKN